MEVLPSEELIGMNKALGEVGFTIYCENNYCDGQKREEVGDFFHRLIIA